MVVRGLWAVIVLVTIASSGCLGRTDSTPPSEEAPESAIQLRPEGGFRYDQHVTVFLVGFDAGVGEELARVLAPEEVHHATYSFARTFPPDPNDPQAPLAQLVLDNPVIPTARYDVVELDDEFAKAFFRKLTPVQGEDAIYDARAAEGLLVSDLRAVGHPLDVANPAVALVHAGELGSHAWRQTFSHGYIQPVRAFGEKDARMTIFDVSAAPDPYVTGQALVVGTTASNAAAATKPYDYPIPSGGTETVGTLRDLVIDLTHFRLLKGPSYPVATAACHHVTLVLAIHATSLRSAIGPVASLMDVPSLESAYENATGEDVVVDARFLNLPQDDPVLDALARGASSYATLDALRWYLDENFDDFVDAKEGCEEYLSILIIGDATQQPINFGGVGAYDVKHGHRIAFSMVSDTEMVTDENGLLQVGGGNPSRTRNHVNFFFAHETGHILGFLHTQGMAWANGTGVELSSFQSVWSTMSYQAGDRIHDFGLMDQGNFQRNRAGFAVKEAQSLGLTETPEFAQAIASFEHYDWHAGFHAIAPLLEGNR